MGMEAIAAINHQQSTRFSSHINIDENYFKKRFNDNGPGFYETLVGPQKIVTKYVGDKINNHAYSTNRWYQEDGKPKVDSVRTTTIDNALAAHEESVRKAETLVARMAIGKR